MRNVAGGRIPELLTEGCQSIDTSLAGKAGVQHRPSQQAQTISEWLKKQMGAGGIPAHNMKAHSINYRLWMTGK